jgi:hypothetical protein
VCASSSYLQGLARPPEISDELLVLEAGQNLLEEPQPFLQEVFLPFLRQALELFVHGAPVLKRLLRVWLLNNYGSKNRREISPKPYEI